MSSCSDTANSHLSEPLHAVPTVASLPNPAEASFKNNSGSSAVPTCRSARRNCHGSWDLGTWLLQPARLRAIVAAMLLPDACPRAHGISIQIRWRQLILSGRASVDAALLHLSREGSKSFRSVCQNQANVKNMTFEGSFFLDNGTKRS